ncbi:hypothetical protein ACJ41O_009115 [Fusarium nematophilum]
MPSAITTSLLMPKWDPQPLVAEVLAADATATTYLLNCNENGADQCGVFDNTLIVGPWAGKTLPPGAASTGTFHYSISMPYDEPWLYSIECEMSRTVPLACTTTNSGGNDEDRQTATFTGTEAIEDELYVTLSFTPVTITAGQELLDGKYSTSEATTSTSSTTQATPVATGGKGSSTEPTGTETSGGVATPESTSAATWYAAGGFTAMALAGLAAMAIVS